jgi:hypothetical protein
MTWREEKPARQVLLLEVLYTRSYLTLESENDSG